MCIITRKRGKEEGTVDSSFLQYLDESLKKPFVLDLHDCTLMEVIDKCIGYKSRRSPRFGKSLGCLIYNLRILERQYGARLKPLQITDIFWDHFQAFCCGRGLRSSSVATMSSQMKSILSWASKYNCQVSPTFGEIKIENRPQRMLALTANDVSRITYFDVDLFYKSRRADFRDTMRRVRDMFVLSCNLFARYSDMVRIGPECFDRNIFRIRQQKTGNEAVVNMDRYCIEPKVTFAILERYGYEAPYKGDIGNYNLYLHILMRDAGFTEPVRIEERIGGQMVATTVPRWKLISSHTARRTAISVNVLRGYNVHVLKMCSGHTDLRCFDKYVCDNFNIPTKRT